MQYNIGGVEFKEDAFEIVDKYHPKQKDMEEERRHEQWGDRPDEERS